jgi:hypothetical protein
MRRELSRFSMSSWPRCNQEFNVNMEARKDKNTWKKYKNISRRLINVNLEECT